MRIDSSTSGFQPITITLETMEEARALKVLCTDTAKNAVSAKDRLNVSSNTLNTTADGIFRELKARGVNYLTPR